MTRNESIKLKRGRINENNKKTFDWMLKGCKTKSGVGIFVLCRSESYISNYATFQSKCYSMCKILKRFHDIVMFYNVIH